MSTTPEEDFLSLGDEILQLQERLMEYKRMVQETEHQIRMLSGARSYIQRKKQLDLLTEQGTNKGTQKPEQELLPYSRISTVPDVKRKTKEENN